MALHLATQESALPDRVALALLHGTAETEYSFLLKLLELWRAAMGMMEKQHTDLPDVRACGFIYYALPVLSIGINFEAILFLFTTQKAVRLCEHVHNRCGCCIYNAIFCWKLSVYEVTKPPEARK